MQGKIVIAGAGQGALVAAYILGKHGYQVDIFEKNRQEELSYDWHDDLTPHVFTRINLPMPEAKHYFKKKDWAFVTPDGNHTIRIYQDEEKVDLSMERRPLIEMLTKRAAGYAKIHYEAAVEGLIIEENRVKGVVVEGTRVYADLVIDSTGVCSVLREQLPEEYKIQRRPAEDEVFHAYRAFYKRKEGSKDPAQTNKAYLKHLGEEGISWYILDDSGQVNLLVGRIMKLDEEALNRGLQALREDNEIIGDEVVRGGTAVAIPVRYPLSRMVGPGYAAVGDSAFMTIPMLGSGIASSMVAGHLLAEVIVRAKQNPFGVENLWHYQVKAMREFGANNAGVDVLKQWLLTADNGDISYLMGRGIVGPDDIKKVAVGELIELSVTDMLKKLKMGYKKIGLLIQLNQVLNKAKRARKLALSIPESFDESKVTAWQMKYDRLLGS